ncbi:MAG: cbb3-type cytochrome c oxidase subunit II [candidate division KSB1 bacterium]|nr:cbb3-type cytochrome c oxidase subunit II [candidate division KSB1 bacterium]MDZ7275874.1 cbb3-type cytochrome c oxidase subunit II [candidate division KSB1 bacterium]MDZ7287624.1 cbb3-type cytochrome c oxidase subunit II [candidate division KSB1 bacterium]MDZ7306786.1 cbb3-type cytochrome c oxidase subunit II [candidate division KSB1 bacterium]MDZ7350602.1 cbb3-type cytochrome c oxidase subunit II [candidate division KSB1 bacterium]
MRKSSEFAFIMLLLLGGNLPAQDKAASPPFDALAGRSIYAAKKCGDCHNQGATKFTAIKKNYDAAGHAKHATDLNLPMALGEPKSERAKKKMLEKESEALAAYLDHRKAADAAPENFVTAGLIMVRESCRNCHLIQGTGSDTGPALAGVGAKRDYKWLYDHFVDPQKFVKDSTMPKFGEKLGKTELEALSAYLVTWK